MKPDIDVFSAYPPDARISQRIGALRAILIILIVYIHIFGINTVHFADNSFVMADAPMLEILKEAVSHVIARCAVPLFFLISGLLLYIKPFTWAANMKKKCRSILVPYLFWNVFWIAFFFIAQSIPFTRPFFATNILSDYTPLQWIACFIRIPGMDMSPFYYPFWFLFDLLVLNLLAKLIAAAADRFPALLLTVTALAWVLDVELYIVSAEALLFFTLGFYVVKYRLVQRADTLSYVDIAPLYAALTVWIAAAAPPRVCLKAAILVGIVFFVRLSRDIVSRDGKAAKLLSFLSTYTFMIFAAHEYTLTILKKAAVRLLPQSASVQLAEYLLLPVAAIALSVVFGMTFSRLLPRLYRLVTGAR